MAMPQEGKTSSKKKRKANQQSMAHQGPPMGHPMYGGRGMYGGPPEGYGGPHGGSFDGNHGYMGPGGPSHMMQGPRGPMMMGPGGPMGMPGGPYGHEGMGPGKKKKRL